MSLSLYHASREGNVEAVNLLLAQGGVEVNKTDENCCTPLHVASDHGHTEVVGLLLQSGADVNQANKNGWTPLNTASYKGHTEVVGLLLQAGANVNQAQKEGATPLYIASQNGHTGTMTLLVFNGAVPKESDLPSLRRCLGPFFTTMRTDYVAMLAFKTCLRGVGVGHALRGISIYGDHPIRCIESYLLPCCRCTCFPLAQARRTILHLWVGEG